MLSLLFILFVYLFSVSEIDPIKYMETTKSIESEIKKNVNTKAVDTIQIEKEKLMEMKKQIEGLIKERGLGDKISVEYTGDKLILNVGDAILFESGKANLKTEARALLGELGDLFKQSDSLILVEGHTDNVPIATSQFPSNWELSSARSASVIRLLETKGVNPYRMSLSGYNQYKPIAINNSIAHKAKNRRVVITLKVNIEKIMREETNRKKQHK
jgi:chemotaxis protein MotB